MILETFETTEKFRYLWLKYVTGFDLSVHCAKSLVGRYSSLFKFGDAPSIIHNCRLDEHPFRYIYLCGVTSRYENNLHLALEENMGTVVDYSWLGTHIVVRDARMIEIKGLQSYDLEPNGRLTSYNTCRNWRFAYQITHGI